MAIETFFSASLAGLITAVVGFSGTAILIFQAATSAGASPAEAASWMASLCLGIGILTVGLSLRYRIPIVITWSTPGAALLATSLIGLELPVAIGTFLGCGLLIIFAGVTGAFEKLMTKIPLSLASAMLAGIILRFGIDLFSLPSTGPALLIATLLAYLVFKRLAPRLSIPAVLIVGAIVVDQQGVLHLNLPAVAFTPLVFVAPEFSWASFVGVTFPLFIVTMTSQNIPGFAAIRASAYDPPVSKIITATGVGTALLAPFGAFALNLAAITAAICLGDEAHRDPKKRFWAAVTTGVLYLLIAVACGSVVQLFTQFPSAYLSTLTGFALLPTLASSLAHSFREEREREAALITFLITASGLTCFGIGPAFWGLVIGIVALNVTARKSPGR